MEERDPLTREVIGAAIEVHRELGPGLLESVYQVCMEHELRLRGIEHHPQRPLPVVYKGMPVEVHLRMDLADAFEQAQDGVAPERKVHLQVQALVDVKVRTERRKTQRHVRFLAKTSGTGGAYRRACGASHKRHAPTRESHPAPPRSPRSLIR